MDYIREYYSIIDFRKQNPLPSDEYGENHHVKPRSLFPELKDDPENIVRLSGKEHFKCHYLLAKHYEQSGDRNAYEKMLWAFIGMSRVLEVLEEDLEDMSQKYQELKVQFSEMRKGQEVSEETRRKISVAGKGKVRSKETKRRISEGLSGRKLSEEHRQHLSESRQGENAPWYGKKHTEEWKQKMSEKLMGHGVSEEAKRKMSEAKKGRPLSEEHKQKLREAHQRRLAARKVS